MAGDVIPPPYVITANDKRGLIVVTGASVLAFVWCCSLIRVWLRWRLKEWRSDDWWLAAATLLDTVQTGIILHLVTLGLGASQDNIPLPQLEQLGKEGFASQLLYIFVILASKLSILFLHLRISPGGSHRIAVWATVALSCIWVVISVVLVSVPCNPTQTILNHTNCNNRWSKWLSIGILDMATEFFIFTLAVLLVHFLHMRRCAKALVVFAFSARLPVIAIAAVRLYFLRDRIAGSYTFDYLVATQWQMGYAIMSCTITGLGPFLKPFDSEYVESYKHYNHSSSHRSASQHMTTSSSASSVLPPRRIMPRKNQDNISESYLMNDMPSRSGSKRTVPDHRRSSSGGELRQSESLPPNAPVMLTADEHFRPTHIYRGHEAEVWVGERSPSFPLEEPYTSSGANGARRPHLVIGKKKEFKIEVDRASRIV
ncbi:hypothetical protein COCMIDRAFT_28909 [Bipolaris oryzae ATCC 44560]|uniref:Rhodopsin domain-containing protein n=1 Tax=Bipolaris oryzae ATCC 44560 TaxID=930090 RepID=W6Z4D3_COCMI|nr:uncharacterized protein COCMIDRAFT_28909 [Bipolaris oryzae ATCC 44560]EUC42474.1 hypothetical protein COCMIDRAFT_28909 [Bipolaris oryzae ATCC 44560]